MNIDSIHGWGGGFHCFSLIFGPSLGTVFQFDNHILYEFYMNREHPKKSRSSVFHKLGESAGACIIGGEEIEYL